MRVRAKSFKNWLLANFTKQDLKDPAQFGANSGWSGLTFYEDTTKLYDKFNEEIWDAIYEDMESFGYKNAYEFLATLGGADNIISDRDHKNLY